jgi:hypothetical protein
LRIVVGGSCSRSAVGGHGVKPRLASRAQRWGSAVAGRAAVGAGLPWACGGAAPWQALNPSNSATSGPQRPPNSLICVSARA